MAGYAAEVSAEEAAASSGERVASTSKSRQRTRLAEVYQRLGVEPPRRGSEWRQKSRFSQLLSTGSGCGSPCGRNGDVSRIAGRQAYQLRLWRTGRVGF